MCYAWFFRIEVKVLFEIKQLKLDKRKTSNISELCLITFAGDPYLDLVLIYPNSQFLLGSLPYLFPRKQKEFSVTYFSCSEYSRTISVFHNGFNHQIIDITYNPQ